MSQAKSFGLLFSQGDPSAEATEDTFIWILVLHSVTQCFKKYSGLTCTLVFTVLRQKSQCLYFFLFIFLKYWQADGFLYVLFISSFPFASSKTSGRHHSHHHPKTIANNSICLQSKQMYKPFLK